MTCEYVTLLAEACLATDIATFASVLRISRNFVLCLNGMKLQLWQVCFCTACALYARGNSSHEFVDVSEESDDAATKSDCEWSWLFVCNHKRLLKWGSQHTRYNATDLNHSKLETFEIFVQVSLVPLTFYSLPNVWHYIPNITTHHVPNVVTPTVCSENVSIISP